jgi:hypothetical protein
MAITPSNTKSWYLNITAPLLIHPNQNATLIFEWATPEGNSVNTVYNAECQCRVFLAFFGDFEPVGAYAQTIPFQAVDIYS